MMPETRSIGQQFLDAERTNESTQRARIDTAVASLAASVSPRLLRAPIGIGTTNPEQLRTTSSSATLYFEEREEAMCCAELRFTQLRSRLKRESRSVGSTCCIDAGAICDT